jgi:hypothetical protein
MRHSEPIEPEAAVQLQQEGVPGKTPCGERLLPVEGLQAHRNALRQTRPKLPGIGLSRGHHRLVDFMSLGPKTVHTGGSRYVSIGLAIGQGETRRLQPQMAVERDGRLSGEALELPA